MSTERKTYPSGLVIAPQYRALDIAWTPPADCTEQRVYVNAAVVAVLPPTTDRYLIDGLEAGVAFVVHIAVPRDYGFGEVEEKSATVCATPTNVYYGSTPPVDPQLKDLWVQMPASKSELKAKRRQLRADLLAVELKIERRKAGEHVYL